MNCDTTGLYFRSCFELIVVCLLLDKMIHSSVKNIGDKSTNSSIAMDGVAVLCVGVFV